MRVQLMRQDSEHGAVAIIVALLSTLLLVIAAFAVDFGMAYSQRQALSTGVDSAALAVVRGQIPNVIAHPTWTCQQLQTDMATTGVAGTTALKSINLNSPFGATISSTAITTAVDCVDATGVVSTTGKTLRVTVGVTRKVPTSIAGVIGVSYVTVNRSAAAVLGAATGISGWRPFALCNNQASAILANAAADVPARSSTYRHEIVPLTKIWKVGSDCDTSGAGAGNWAWTYCSSGGSSSLATDFLSGCSTPLVLDPSTTPASVNISGLAGNKGSSSQLLANIQAMMDQTIVMPVYTSFTGTGSNVTFKVIGFMGLKLCGFQSGTKTYTGTCYATQDSLVTPNTAGNVALTSDSWQVQYISYTPVGDLNATCGIGSGASCPSNAYVTKLVQ